ncbi:MAG TPA: ParB/RepB/Spo0J family partition protein, partial [Candidatus Ornithospirochaeta stercorigallinarum]|nr:ParB/RepB/Spo0J family partition protein [Candidatus Ornithospirochaeta stercorigallinarum]
SSIMANPNQPRKSFDEDSLNDLAESIKSQGVIQPIIVEEYAPGKFSIIAGERRFRAAQIAGLKNIPSIVKNLGEIQRMEVSLIENVQRENLNPVEEAFAYQYLIQKSGYTQEEVAKKVGKSRSAITNSIRLLNLPDTIKDDLISGLITSGHARAILSLVNPSDQMLLRNKIVEGDLSVREAEALADDYNKGRKIVQKKKEKGKDPEVLLAEEKFINAIGAKVEIKGTLNRGRLMVRFRTQKELERIYAYLSNGDDLFEE